jgi:hypothetical protein
MWQGIWNAIEPWLVAGVGGAMGAALLLPTKLGEVIFKLPERQSD